MSEQSFWRKDPAHPNRNVWHAPGGWRLVKCSSHRRGHPAGWWLQGAIGPAGVDDYIAERITTAMPVAEEYITELTRRYTTTVHTYGGGEQ